MILLIGALAVGGKGLNLGIDFTSGTRVVAELNQKTDEQGVRDALDRDRPRQGEDPADHAARSSPAGRRSRSRPTRSRAAERARGRADAERGVRRRHLQLPDDRPDVRQHGRQERDHRDHRVADRDQQLHRAQIRVEIRGAGADSADARPADHGRRLRAVRLRGDDGDRRRPADDPRLLALRHDHRVRPHPRERAADAARRVLADHQPLDERSADALARDVAVARCCRSSRCCFFGGETLKDFAFALAIGILSGTYSSIFIASPVLMHWKEGEGVWRARRKRVAAATNDGHVPAYATAAGGAATEVEIEEQQAARAPHRAGGSDAGQPRPSSTSWCASCTARRPAPRPRRTRRTPRRRRRRRRDDARDLHARGPRPQGRPQATSPSDRATSATGGDRRWDCSPGP